MPFLQHFFVGDRLLGAAEREAVRVHEDVRPPASVLIYCEQCGEVYARCPVADPQGNISPWMAYRKRCVRHPPTYMFSDIPGSLWLSWDRAFTDALPMPVLQYELERHLEAFERLEKDE